MTRTPSITRTILKILQACEGHALPEDVLREHLDERERPRVSDAEFAPAKEWLVANDCIKELPGKFGSTVPRWLITESGQVRLAQ